MEDKKKGRPLKFSKEYMKKMKAVYDGERANDRHIQNHIYQSYSFPLIMRYHKEHPIENFEFLYKDDTYFKQTVFTELGRTNEFIGTYFSQEEADEYVIDLAKEICLLAKNENNKVASRLIERIIREDRMELKKRLKENGD
jgi:phage anti-repressor protein